jgi:hypothetical protein
MIITCSPRRSSSRVRKSAAFESAGFNNVGLAEARGEGDVDDWGEAVQLRSATAASTTKALKATILSG